ncbi:MAG: antitermination protein N [Mixta calida]|nr:hypothetical protein [Pantoea sp.]MDU5828536.1 antitermination protein N [Mixta calida]
MNAQERRRAARAEKQAEWKQANPLLVGVKAKPTCRPILTLNRKPVDRVVKAVSVQTTKTYDTLDNCCLPQVAIFSVKSKRKESITARA